MNFIPKMSAYSIQSDGRKKYLKRRARFAPQLLAEGLSSGIVSDQGNLVHGAFDEGTDIDPYVNISSDKFETLQKGLAAVAVDPSTATTPPPSSDVD